MSKPADTHVVTSADGTSIATSRVGSGPALVLVDGAMCHRRMGPMTDLAEALSTDFTVWTYDRRGRGESGPDATTSLADDDVVARETEDLAAVIEAAGGHAVVLGCSSGAALSVEAAKAGLPIDRLFLYELPAIVDDSREPSRPTIQGDTRDLLAKGDRSGAVWMFMREVGLPAPMLWVMRLLPMWKQLKGIAHTLPHDHQLTFRHRQGRPFDRAELSSAAVETVVYGGGKSPAYMRSSNRALAEALPQATYVELPGQTHMIKARVLAPAVTAAYAEATA